jgi:hypothetical protein
MGVRAVASMSMEIYLVFYSPKRGVFILVLGDELVSHDIEKWDTHCATNAGQNGLHLLKYLCGGGCVKGYGDVVRLLVLRRPIISLRFCILSKLTILIVVLKSCFTVMPTTRDVWS